MGPWPWVIGGSVVLLALAASGGAAAQKPPFRVVPGRRQPDAYPPLGSLPARITSAFAWRADPKTGERKHHQGTDVSAPIGTPLYAPVDGVISRVVVGNPTMGNAVCVRARGYRWWFLHLSEVFYPIGTPVIRGQAIGLTGNTGRTTGPHLHITVEDETQGGAKTNPQSVYPVTAFGMAPVAAGFDVGFTGPNADDNRKAGAGRKTTFMPNSQGGTQLGDLGDSEAFVDGDNVEHERRRMAAETTAIVNTYNIGQQEAFAIVRAADWVGGSGLHLARVMWAESRMKPAAVNKATGASGLIQFMPATAKKLGTTVERIRRMNFLQQMPYVEDYLERVALGQWAGGEEGLLDTQFKMAAAVFYPAWRNRAPSTVLPAAVQKVNPGIRTMGSYLDFVLAAKTPLDRKVQSAGLVLAAENAMTTGSITGEKNPCNQLVEAHRVDKRLSKPDREMLLTYKDMVDPGIMSECADEVIVRAKRAGRKPGDDQAALRTGVKSWYTKGPVASASSSQQRGTVTFSSSNSRFG